MALGRPVYAAETADGTTARTVALHVAPGSVARGDLVQTFTPLGYRFFVLGRKSVAP